MDTTSSRTITEDYKNDLLREWHSLIARLDSLHDEAWAIHTFQNARMQEIWSETHRIRRRIAVIAATGVIFRGD